MVGAMKRWVMSREMYKDKDGDTWVAMKCACTENMGNDKGKLTLS
jgi:hypothetical protein